MRASLPAIIEGLQARNIAVLLAGMQAPLYPFLLDGVALARA